MAEKTVKIALIGLGTVGSGVAKILLERADLIHSRTGLRLELVHIVDKDLKRLRPIALPPGLLHSDIEKVIRDPAVSIAVELVGGTTFAGELQMKLLAAGKDVVTANKALLAERGEEIFAAARKQGRCVAFEASCCGGIPVIGAIATGLTANQISAMYGIVNGTCNYILTGMSQEGKDYDTALREAQAAGYAEADPTLDVSGADSAHKLAILAGLAFGKQIDYQKIPVQGIDGVQLADIHYGCELGYTMKLLAIAEDTAQGLSLRVHPSFISDNEPLAQVSGAYNAVSIFGDAVGHTSYFGRGAGMMPTASAVVADIIGVARGSAGQIFRETPGLGRTAEPCRLCPTADIMSKFYLRLSAIDKPGVFAQIAQVLGDHQIGISGCLQHESESKEVVPVVIMTHLVRKGNLDQALNSLEKLEVIKAKPICINVVTPPTGEPE